MTKPPALVTSDPWRDLRRHTAARVALGRVGTSLPTDEVLRFGLAHAHARDAVHLPLDVDTLVRDVRQAGFGSLVVNSRAEGRTQFLLRPDLGRSLFDADAMRLRAENVVADVAFVIGDGLSAVAAQRHAVPLLVALRPMLPPIWRFAPVVVATQARVALGDEIAASFKARLAVMLIGERPGLSAPDSLGIYLTYRPRAGCTDAERNCISNVRPAGLGYEEAARKLAWLMGAAVQLQLTGVGLKDESGIIALVFAGGMDTRG